MAYTVTKDFVLEKGARVGVWFKHNNIGSQNLNVDGTGAFQWISARKSDGTIVSDTPTMYKAGGQLHWFTFDGEYWLVDDSIRAGEDTVGKVTLAEIRAQAARNHYTKGEIDTKISTAVTDALTQAKESGEFKGDPGEPGDDYVLTEADKTEIAQEAAGLVDTALLSIIGTGEVTA